MNLKKGFFRLTWVISIVGTFLITTIIHLSNPATLKEFFAIWGMYFLLTWGVYLFIKFVIIGFITKGFVGVEKSNTEINNTTPHELGPKITKIRKVGVGYIVGGAVCLFVSFAFYRPGNNVLAVVAGVGFLSLVIGIYQLTTGKKVKKRTGFFWGLVQGPSTEISCPNCNEKKLWLTGEEKHFLGGENKYRLGCPGCNWQCVLKTEEWKKLQNNELELKKEMGQTWEEIKEEARKKKEEKRKSRIK